MKLRFLLRDRRLAFVERLALFLERVAILHRRDQRDDPDDEREQPHGRAGPVRTMQVDDGRFHVAASQGAGSHSTSAASADQRSRASGPPGPPGPIT